MKSRSEPVLPHVQAPFTERLDHLEEQIIVLANQVRELGKIVNQLVNEKQ